MALAQGTVQRAAQPWQDLARLASAAALLGVRPGQSTAEHVVRGAALLGYPVVGRAVGLFTRGVPAEIELQAGSRPGAVAGALRWFGPTFTEASERVVRALQEVAELYRMAGDPYRKTLAEMLAAALLKAQATGPVPLEGRGRIVLDILRIIPVGRR